MVQSPPKAVRDVMTAQITWAERFKAALLNDKKIPMPLVTSSMEPKMADCISDSFNVKRKRLFIIVNNIM